MRNLDPRRENPPPVRLGELALHRGFISKDQLQLALTEQEKEAKTGRLPRQLGLILLTLGFLGEVDLMNLLAEQEKQRAEQSKKEAPAPQTGDKGGVRNRESIPGLKKQSAVPVWPNKASGGAPTPGPFKHRERGS